MDSITANGNNVNLVKDFFNNIQIPSKKVMVTTVCSESITQLAVFEYFQITNSYPPICFIAIPNNSTECAAKTLYNLMRKKQCVINFPNKEFDQLMEEWCNNLDETTREVFKDSVVFEKSQQIDIPRIVSFSIQCECVVNHIIPLGENENTNNLVMLEAKVLHKNGEVFVNEFSN